MIVTKHLRIRGKVQGVGFRAAMYREAVRLNVTGWVRNRGDGTVEAVVQGPDKSVIAIMDWAERGPLGATVDNIETESADGIFPDFELLQTAE